MAKTLQFRRDTTSNLASVTGSAGEIFIDTTKQTVVVMDGSTTGGTPLALESALPTNTNQLTNGAGFITSSDISGKQATLISGTNIKTVNGTSLLGSGNISISGGSGGSTEGYTFTPVANSVFGTDWLIAETDGWTWTAGLSDHMATVLSLETVPTSFFRNNPNFVDDMSVWTNNYTFTGATPSGAGMVANLAYASSDYQTALEDFATNRTTFRTHYIFTGVPSNTAGAELFDGTYYKVVTVTFTPTDDSILGTPAGYGFPLVFIPGTFVIEPFDDFTIYGGDTISLSSFTFLSNTRTYVDKVLAHSEISIGSTDTTLVSLTAGAELVTDKATLGSLYIEENIITPLPTAVAGYYGDSSATTGEPLIVNASLDVIGHDAPSTFVYDQTYGYNSGGVNNSYQGDGNGNGVITLPALTSGYPAYSYAEDLKKLRAGDTIVATGANGFYTGTMEFVIVGDTSQLELLLAETPSAQIQLKVQATDGQTTTSAGFNSLVFTYNHKAVSTISTDVVADRLTVGKLISPIVTGDYISSSGVLSAKTYAHQLPDTVYLNSGQTIELASGAYDRFYFSNGNAGSQTVNILIKETFISTDGTIPSSLSTSPMYKVRGLQEIKFILRTDSSATGITIGTINGQAVNTDGNTISNIDKPVVFAWENGAPTTLAGGKIYLFEFTIYQKQTSYSPFGGGWGLELFGVARYTAHTV